MSHRTALLCLLSLDVSAQNQPFRVQTNVVQVPVRVTDKKGRNIDGLTPQDFRLEDNGVAQIITLDEFSTVLPPVSLVIAIQSTNTARLALAKIRRIAGMVQPLVSGPRGEAAVVTFDNEVNWLQEFTREDEKIRAAIKSLKPGDGSRARMFDAVMQAAERLRPRAGRKILVLISEGRDQGSVTKFHETMETVERDGIEVFGARYSAYATSWISKSEEFPDQSELNAMFFAQLARLGATNHTKALAAATGGADYPFLRERGVEDAIVKLGEELHTQYLLSFVQHEPGEGLHNLEVSVPEHKDYEIRARRNYWSLASSH
jgi:VWFA-related protein